LPATFDNATNIFDRVAARNGEERLSWDRWFEACGRNQGHVFEAYLKNLISRKPKVRESIKKRVEGFVALVRDEADGNFARDIAEKFGLVYAAGELAIQFGLVPWKSVALRGAIEKCYRGSRDLLPDQGLIFRSGKQALLSYLQGLPKLASIDPTDCSSLDGFRTSVRGYHRCLVKREKFNSVFATDAQLRLITGWLITSQRVTLAKRSAGPKKTKEQFLWPDGERYRSVEILWPQQQDTGG
jgi:hypothetical protein